MFRYLDSENNTMDVYRESGPTFFSSLTTAIQSITIDSHLSNNLIQDMANSNCQPHRLRLLNRMVDPLQMLCIKNWNKLKSLEIECHIPNQIYSHPISYTLTKLYMRLWNKTVCIDWFLGSFPYLEELEIDGKFSLTTTENVGINQSPNLYKLSVRMCTISQTCLDVLRLAAPNMRELDLRARWSNVNINISDWDLKVLNLGIRGKASSTPLLYRIVTQNCTKIMKYDQSDPSPVVVKNSSRFCLDKMVSIQSSREKQFKFNGFSILLSLDNVTIDFEK
jgi:hypothetical protein